MKNSEMSLFLELLHTKSEIYVDIISNEANMFHCYSVMLEILGYLMSV